MSFVSGSSLFQSKSSRRVFNERHHIFPTSQLTYDRYARFTASRNRIKNNADIADTLLATLKPVDRSERSDVLVRPCMEVTRRYIFKEIDQWLDDLEAPNILLLRGDPGTGKSAVASAITEKLTLQDRLGSSFCFRRGGTVDPAALWRTVAHDLAEHYSAFRHNLVGVLQDRGDVVQRPDIKLHFQLLVAEPLIKSFTSPIKTFMGLAKLYKPFAKASGQATPYKIPVIFIDALDECESDHSQASQRQDVLATLAKWSHLPKHFKLVVTSRNEGMSESFLATCKQISFASGIYVTNQVNEDIHRFFEERFAKLPGRSSGWPSKEVLQRLTSMAAGVFIWAETVMRLLEEEGELPTTQLELILAGNFGHQNNLATLYQLILRSKFKGSAWQKYKTVVAAILLAKSPFHRDDLHLFLSRDKADVAFILDKLSSVLSIGKDERIRIRHLSFREFLCDSHRCPVEFFIDCAEYQGMALRCFQHMKALKFNMCDLETSYIANVRVNDIEERIQMKIPSPLLYSCCFWAFHLRDMASTTNGVDVLLKELEEFFYARFLYWMEVMSLLGRVPEAYALLHTVVTWIETLDTDLSAFARDANQFIIDFNDPISFSAPHIYLSALPFAPSESLVGRHYGPRFSNTISVISGQDKNWPAMTNLFQVHEHIIKSIAISPDGTRIVSGSKDKTIRVWDSNTGEIIAGPFKGHTDCVTSVSFSPDGRHVASGSKDRTIHVLDVNLGNVIAGPFQGHTDWINSVSFSPDGRHVVSGSNDRTIRVWDVNSGKVFSGPFIGHTDWVNSVSFSPDGRRVVSGSSDGTIRVWNVDSGNIIAAPFEGHIHWVNSVSFSPDGRHVVSGSSDRTIRVWDVDSGNVIAGPFKGHTNWVKSVSFSPDGRRVVSGSNDRTVRVWDVDSGNVIAGPFKGHTCRVNSVSFLPDGRHVVSGSNDKTIRVWDIELSRSATHRLSSSTTASHPVLFNICKEDGWVPVSNPDGLPANDGALFWVPLSHRAGLCTEETVAILNVEHVTKLDLRRFEHGTSWTKCRSIDSL